MVAAELRDDHNPPFLRSQIVSVKSILKRSVFYPRYFAWRYGVDPSLLSSEEARWERLYADFLRPGLLVFDIGANVGARAKVFWHLGCGVIAVEPQRQCVMALRRSFGNDITIIHAAVSDHSGSAKLHLTGYHEIATMSPSWMEASKKSGRFRGIAWDRTETVRTVTLDQLINEYGQPDFIKIDVEGFEETVLRGLSQAVPALSFETHPEQAQAAVACVEKLRSLGEYHFSLSIGDSAQFGERHDSETIRQVIEKNPLRSDIYAMAQRPDPSGS